MADLLADRYELTGLVGRGPTGTVWSAQERGTRERAGPGPDPPAGGERPSGIRRERGNGERAKRNVRAQHPAVLGDTSSPMIPYIEEASHLIPRTAA